MLSKMWLKLMLLFKALISTAINALKRIKIMQLILTASIYLQVTAYCYKSLYTLSVLIRKALTSIKESKT